MPALEWKGIDTVGDGLRQIFIADDG